MSDCKCSERRDFLKLGGATLFLSAISPTLAQAHPTFERVRRVRMSGKTLVHVWLRGAQDGLNVVVPTEASEYAIYQSYRPTIGLPMAQLSGQQLTPDFALHPATQAGLYDLWTQGQVAVLPTVGYAESSRSHFDSQRYFESGTPGDKTTADGWLNRYLQGVGSNGDPLQALSFTSDIPLTMSGPASALSFTNLSQLNVSTNAGRDTKFLDAQRQIYPAYQPTQTYDAEVGTAGTDLVAAIDAIRASPLPPPSVTYPSGSFGTAMSQLAQLIRSGSFMVEVANVELNGWDTHTQQATPFASLLTQLSDGIKAFSDDLGPSLMQDTIIVTVSEFGRTARENGNQGTDHGNAITSFVVGPTVNPGIYLGAGWPGLANLRDNRDLEETVEFRDLYSEILTEHMGSLDPAVFPQWTYTRQGFLG